MDGSAAGAYANSPGCPKKKIKDFCYWGELLGGNSHPLRAELPARQLTPAEEPPTIKTMEETPVPPPSAELLATTADPNYTPPAPLTGRNEFWKHSDGRPRGHSGALTQITHAMIIDFLIANPGCSRQDIADAFGYRSLQSITLITNSDSFKAAFAARKKDMVDPVVIASVEDRIRGLANRSAELLAEKLEQPNPSEKLLLQVFRESTRAGNYGVAGGGAPVQNNFVVALPGPAASSQEWVKRFNPNAASDAVVRPQLERAVSEAEIKEGRV